MAIQKGSEVLIGREDSTYSGSYNLIGGQQSGDLEVTDPTAEFTHKTSPGLWAEAMDGGTSRSVSVNIGGVVIDDSDLDAIFAAVMGSGARHQSYGFLLPGLGLVTATFHNPGFTASGELNNPEGFTLQGQSAGDVTFAQGITNRYDMQASVVLNFAKSCYSVSGTHYTTPESVAGMTVVRASGKTNGGGWDLQHGTVVPGALTEVAANVLATFSGVGLVTEQASTNEVRNPRCEGASAGTPGTAPTNFTVNAGGASSSIVGSGYSDGHPYFDVRIFGTPVSDPDIAFESTTQITAATGETWTTSVGVQLVGGDLTNINGLRIRMVERSGGGYVVETVNPVFTPDASQRRFFATNTLSGGGSVDSVQPYLAIDWNDAGAIDITIRVFAPQTEQLAFPTTPIFPAVSSPAATTRARDDAVMANGAWANDGGPGAFFVDFTDNVSDGSADYCTPASVGTATEWIYPNSFNTTPAYLATMYSGGTFADLSGANQPQAAGQRCRTGFSWALNDVRAAANSGGSVSTADDVSQALVAGNLGIEFGSRNDGATPVKSMWIKAVVYWPFQLSDEDLTNRTLEG